MGGVRVGDEVKVKMMQQMMEVHSAVRSEVGGRRSRDECRESKAEYAFKVVFFLLH